MSRRACVGRARRTRGRWCVRLRALRLGNLTADYDGIRVYKFEGSDWVVREGAWKQARSVQAIEDGEFS